MNLDLDTAYLAGFFDGEGCVSCTIYGSLSVSVGQHANSSAVLLRFQRRFGGNIAYKQTRNMAYWNISGSSAARFLEAVLPFLVVKRKQSELAIKFQSLYVGKYDQANRELKDTLGAMISLLKKQGCGRFDESIEEDSQLARSADTTIVS